VLVLVEGPAADVLAITPPAVITDAQLEYALGIIETALGDGA
jgi:4-aminobutyrate aminotransferase-like enzyme